jgi:hypothetical protein
VAKEIPHSLSTSSRIDEDWKGRDTTFLFLCMGLFTFLPEHGSFPSPGVPASFEAFEEFLDNGTLDHDSCIPPAPTFSSQVQTGVFVGDVESSGKGFLGIDHNELSMISMNIMKGSCPFERMRGPDTNTCLAHLFPKASRGPKRAKMIIKEKNLHPLPALLFQ